MHAIRCNGADSFDDGPPDDDTHSNMVEEEEEEEEDESAPPPDDDTTLPPGTRHATRLPEHSKPEQCSAVQSRAV